MIAFIDEKVPYNKKEEALAIIHANGYALTNMNEIISKINPMDGSDWTKQEKEKFTTEIFRLRKDMRALSRTIQKDMKCCLAYYLGTFKKSSDYRLLKTVCVDERIEKSLASVHGSDACAICGDGGSLLICDGCEGEYRKCNTLHASTVKLLPFAKSYNSLNVGFPVIHFVSPSVAHTA